MKRKFAFMLSFFLISLVIAVLFLTHFYSYEKDKLIKETSAILTEITKDKAEKINEYLSKTEEEIQGLQESDEIKRLLKKDLVSDNSVIKFDVNQKSKIISKEVENYLRAYPEMTLKDLQESREFRNIAVQPVGKNGYSFLFDSQNLINYFHKESRRIEYDYKTIEKSFPELWKMFKKTYETGYSEGFYKRDEENGSVSYKYGVFKEIPVKTADNFSLAIGTTAYVDDYKIIKDKSTYLENLKEDLEHHNLILVSSEGYVAYMVNDIEDIGTNLEWHVNLNSGLSKNYYITKETEDISFYGPFIRHYGDIYPKISIMAPVSENEELLGYVALVEDIDRIFDITEEIVTKSETEESYLINKDLLLISPLRKKHLDILVQSVDTENSRECAEDLREKGKRAFEEEYKEKEKRELSISEDYMGDITIGTDFPFPELKWCLLSEIDKSEAIDGPLKENLVKTIYLSIIFILILVVIGFYTGNYLDSKYKSRKARKFPCGVKSMSQPWYCRLLKGICKTYPQGSCGKVIKIRRFFMNLKLRYYFLFALIFSVFYFFLVTSFFQGWQNAKFFDDIPDLFIFIVGFMIFVQGFKIKDNNARSFIIFGGLFICIRRLFDVPFQEWQQVLGTILPPQYWVPVISLELTGFLLLLIGFRRLKK